MPNKKKETGPAVPSPVKQIMERRAAIAPRLSRLEEQLQRKLDNARIARATDAAE